MRLSLAVAKQIAKKLGFYVYVYVNPIDNSVFYVGKGKDFRALTHLDDAGNVKVRNTIREINNLGKEPKIELLAYSLESDDMAFKIEAAAIEVLKHGKLCNSVRGRGTKHCRKPIEDVIADLSELKSDISEPSVLIRINQFYEPGMSDVELYDSTRSCWKIAEQRRDKLELAFAIYKGTVREVYKITNWLPGGSTFCTYRNGRGASVAKRWEFVGVIAADDVRMKYLNRSVKKLYSKGAQNPIQYVNCE